MSAKPSAEQNLAQESHGLKEETRQARRVVLLAKRHEKAEEELLDFLETQLKAKGFSVFLDRHQTAGVTWAEEIEREISAADAVVPLLSARSVHSEMLAFEVELACEASQKQNGRPEIMPIRVKYEGPLTNLFPGMLNSVQYDSWGGEEDDQRVVVELINSLKNLSPRSTVGAAAKPCKFEIGTSAPSSPPPPTSVGGLELEPVGGAVPLNSKFYVWREADEQFLQGIKRGDSIILVKGARQMGKTSLLARGLQEARQAGARVALTDCQKLNAWHLESLQNFFLYLAESITDQLGLDQKPQEFWTEQRGPSVNFERYLRRVVLKDLGAHLVWGLDEVDRLFGCNFGSEVFGLFRSWHNERALDPQGPWGALTLAIAYATEAHLFITDMNQSPFNVGTRLAMEDFSAEQVADLNARYGAPLKNQHELAQLFKLVSGHPFMVRSGLHEMVTQQMSIAEFESEADRDDGVFGDHLRRILLLLGKEPRLCGVVRGVLQGKPCPDSESFYRLRSAGLMTGTSSSDVRPRCEVYARFLKRHLL